MEESEGVLAEWQRLIQEWTDAEEARGGLDRE